MKTSLIRILPIAIMSVAMSIAIAAPVRAGTLENMERERAHLIHTLLDAEISPVDRQAKMEAAQHRLIDLERMVLRDDSLVGRNTPHVRRAFANYDMTFLVHASAESSLTLADTWLQQLGITTQNLLATKVGRR